MSQIPALCALITEIIARLESAKLNNPAVDQALRDLRWAEHNIRNQAAGLEFELREVKAGRRL